MSALPGRVKLLIEAPHTAQRGAQSVLLVFKEVVTAGVRRECVLKVLSWLQCVCRSAGWVVGNKMQDAAGCLAGSRHERVFYGRQSVQWRMWRSGQALPRPAASHHITITTGCTVYSHVKLGLYHISQLPSVTARLRLPATVSPTG